MKYNEPELKDALAKFDIVLKNTPDTPNSLYIFKNFIKYFIKVPTKELTLPASEIMSIIQHEKPLVYNLLKKQDSSYLFFLTNINLDYQEAQKKLSDITEKLK